MIEYKSVVKSEQSSVNMPSQFWIESDNISSQCFWILKFIYQNCTTSTLYHNKIFRRIKQSTKKILISNISTRLFGLGFISDNIIKSEAMKFVVKIIFPDYK